MVFAGLLAGGIGSRMNMKSMPKQFLPLGNKPVIMHTIDCFLRNSSVDYIYIGTHSEWIDYMNDLLKVLTNDQRARIRVIVGGEDRTSTILNIIASIESDFDNSDESILMTHDVVRPFIPDRVIKENIDGALQYGAVDTVMPSADTIVVSHDGTTIDQIPNRSQMYLGQTPQSFRIGLIKELYATLTNDEITTLTDACKVCIIRNYPVHLVRGSSNLFKITTQEDYLLAQAFISMKLEICN